MPKLHQLIPIVAERKAQATSVLTKIHHLVQKPEPLSGINRTYQPRDEDGEKLPSEGKKLQYTVQSGIEEVNEALRSLFEIVATQDVANTQAFADIKVDGHVLATKVPATHLLFLEKRLVDIQTFVDKLPVLDPADDWHYDPNTDCYVTPPIKTTRSKKVPTPFVKSPATEHHPAQVDVVHEDRVVGDWTTIKFSGAIEARYRAEMMNRIRKLREAVKMAREEANSVEAPSITSTQNLLDYIFTE